MKIKISEKTEEEIICASRRGYQNGIAALCACYPEGAEEALGFVVVKASRNWYFQNPECRVLKWLEMLSDDVDDEVWNRVYDDLLKDGYKLEVISETFYVPQLSHIYIEEG